MKFKCEQVEQITVSLENRPGILADLCAHLSDHHVNLRALVALDGAASGNGRLVADDPESARQVLAEAGVEFSSQQCLALEMPNNPGGLADMARTLSLAGVNIDYMYASGLPRSGRTLGVFGVSDLERALALDWGS